MVVDGRIAVVLGTRPEIIKMAEIVRLLGDRAMLIHTGQHWDEAMSGRFMTHLGLPDPDVSLAVGGTSRGTQIAQTLQALDDVFARVTPAAVMVQGDTNTVVGGALAANARGIPLVHVEAGLRSFDRRMPEEHNRVVTDHLADLCLAPTEHSRQLLLAEEIPDERIVVTGNTVVGAVTRALSSGADAAAATIARFGLEPGAYIVATIHRPENTDSPDQLTSVLGALARIATTCPVLIPLHPRTRNRAVEFGLDGLLDDLTLLDPLGYDEFVALCAHAALAISDSGGIQEEASVWKKPVIVVRRSTERPEVLGSFAHLTDAGASLEELAARLFRDRKAIAEDLAGMASPYGDLGAAQRCIDATDELLRCDR